MSDPGIAATMPSLLSAMPLPLVIANTEGRLLVFNPAAEATFGYPASEALEHLALLDLFEREEDLVRQLEFSGERTQATLRAADGERFLARLSSTQVDALTILIIEDLRPVQALERRLSETSRQLVDAERRASNPHLSQAPHHLNQPLTRSWATSSSSPRAATCPRTSTDA